MNETLQQIVAEIRKAAQVERDRSWVGAPHGADEWKLDDWADRIERALPSHVELERDAGRYRWLRDDQTSHLYVRHNNDGEIYVATGATLDALIDARAKEGKTI